MTNDEFQLAFLNKLEEMSRQLDKLTLEIKRNSDAASSLGTANKELKETVGSTNKTFEQVASYLKDIYAKIQGLELIQKLVSGMGPMFKPGK